MGKAKKIGKCPKIRKIPNLKRKILKNMLILTNLAVWTPSNIRKIRRYSEILTPAREPETWPTIAEAIGMFSSTTSRKKSKSPTATSNRGDNISALSFIPPVPST